VFFLCCCCCLFWYFGSQRRRLHNNSSMNAGGPYTHPAEPSWVSVLTPNLFDAKRSTSASERKKKTKQKSAIQDRRVLDNHICAFRSSRIKQPTFFFFNFPLDDRQLCLDRLSTNGRLEGGWLASNDMHRHRSTTFLLIPRSNNPTTNFDIV
jgi:hypothetical protein